jgi:hypothetical protein
MFCSAATAAASCFDPLQLPLPHVLLPLPLLPATVALPRVFQICRCTRRMFCYREVGTAAAAAAARLAPLLLPPPQHVLRALLLVLPLVLLLPLRPRMFRRRCM